MELRDLYDENRNLTGETIEKGEKVPVGRYYLTVAVFIQNDKEEFLLQINKKYDMWSTTGGHPKSGENSLDGIVTEIKEELGYDVDRNKLKLIKTYKTEDDFVDLYYLKENIDLNTLSLQEEEVGNISWFNESKIKELIRENKFLPPHIEYFNDCLDYIKKEQFDFNKIIKDFMKEEYAKEIVNWNYEGKYSEYNLPSYEECKEKKYGITREDRKDNYIVYILNNEVVFYSNMKLIDNNRLYIGVGLKPSLCGKHLGNFFLEDSLKEMKKRYPDKTLFLEVRSWNERAIKSYEKIGFKMINKVISKDRLGNDTEFIQMELSK